MRRRCRLCKQTVADESMFCEKHRNQAELFSASFGPAPGEESDASTSGAPGDPSRPASPISAPASATTTGATVVATRIDTDGLISRVAAAFDKIRDRAREHAERDANRWPQISIYCLHDRLHARPYYSIVPRNQDGAAPLRTYLLTENRVLDAVSDGGDVFAELVEQFEQQRERLTQRELQTLDIHFLNYAGLIAINEHLPDQTERNLVTFELKDQEFVRVAAAEVHDRLRHERW